MANNAQNQRIKSIDDVVAALNANPPRVRSALEGLRWLFEHRSDTPPAVLTACARLLNSEEATSPEILKAVRAVHAEWEDYGQAERALFHKCVYTSETRANVAVTELADITGMLRVAPPRVQHALDGLRWIDAATQGKHRALFTVCATLLKNPSATHPAIVDAVQTGHRVWPQLDNDQRALLMACVYASKERATIARRRAAAQERQRETESGDIHRCGNCDGNLAGTPDLPYCSDACRREAEASTRPTRDTHTQSTTARPAQPERIPAEQRARETTVGPIEAQYDERYREIEAWIPNAGIVRKDDRVADAYEDDRPADHFTDDRNDASDLTGGLIRDDDHERIALEIVDPRTLCAACNLPRTRTEQGHTDNDGRCVECAERDRVPLSVIRDEVRIAAQAPDAGKAIVETLAALEALDVLRVLTAK